MEFAFEKLEVYRRAVRLVGAIEPVVIRCKGKISYSFLDQLTRAVTSISLNVAEGNGRGHSADKRNFMFIARGSAFECVPLLQIFKEKKLLSEEEYRGLYSELVEISKMLSALATKFGSES